jgi:exonuclease III
MHQSWIDDFEKEIDYAKESGMEVIILGDINIDYTGGCTNNKWANKIQEQSHKLLTPLLELHHLHN